MNKNSNIVIGSIFIALGALFLMSNLGYLNFSWSFVWPLALLIPGLYMHFAFFTGIDKNPGILVPGGILTTYGALFYANVFFGWHLMANLWPLFLIGVAIGLLELYIFGSHDKGLLVPVVILGGIGASALFRNYIRFDLKDYFIPLLLIVIGIAVITGRGRKKDNK
ncbi:MAG: LiaI-LiaF-like domain-containing protein [Caulobacteraceae bacterium]